MITLISNKTTGFVERAGKQLPHPNNNIKVLCTETIIAVGPDIYRIEVHSNFHHQPHNSKNRFSSENCWQHVKVTLTSPTGDIEPISWIQSQQVKFKHDPKFINRQLAIACRAIGARTSTWYHRLFPKLGRKRQMVIRNFVQAQRSNISKTQ